MVPLPVVAFCEAISLSVDFAISSCMSCTRDCSGASLSTGIGEEGTSNGASGSTKDLNTGN